MPTDDTDRRVERGRSDDTEYRRTEEEGGVRSFEVNISAGEPWIAGANASHPGLLDARIPLQPSPPAEWARIFNGVPPNVVCPTNMPPPHVSGGTVIASVAVNDVERHIAKIDEFIAATNLHYNRRIAPTVRRRQIAAEATTPERHDRA